jgi:hypothetical protein
MSFQPASLPRITRHESVKVASPFAEGDEASACVVPTRRSWIHASAAGSWASISWTSEPVAICSMLRSAGATCSARCATSGTGIGETVGGRGAFG